MRYFFLGYSAFPFLDYVAGMPCKKVLILRDALTP